MTPLLVELSPREEQVILLFADGLGHREIAVRLDISPLTVRDYTREARRKLGAATIAQAVAIVVRARADVLMA